MSIKDLKSKISDSNLRVLIGLTPVVEKELMEDIHLRASMNHDITEYDKGTTKDYYYKSELDLSEKFAYCLHTAYLDAGFDPHESGELQDALNEEHHGKITALEGHSNLRMRQMVIEGSVRASSMDFGILDTYPCYAKISVLGIPAKTELTIFQELVLEAYALQHENNERVAFFTYFTALEALVSAKLAVIAKGLFEELHYALEHLPLEHKVRVIFKHYAGAKFAKLPIYSELQGLLSDVKKKRNDLAHGKTVVKISDDDVVDILCVILVLVGYTEVKLDTFVKIRKHYYKKDK